MQPLRLYHCAWILPALLAALVSISPAPAGERGNCAWALAPDTVTAAEGSELAPEFDILSWNIQKASNRGWDTDLASFADGVELAFIQEASLQAQLAQVIPGPYHDSFAEGYTTPDRNTGVMTLSTGAPSGHCQLTSMEPWLGTPKASNITVHPLRDREYNLLAINLHAVNFEFGLEGLDSQFRALREVLGAHEGPVIFAGDLNTWSSDRQALVDDFMGEYGLASVSFEPDLRTQAFGRALDHIYVRGLRAEEAQVIPVTSSDHNPLRVRLSLQ